MSRCAIRRGGSDMLDILQLAEVEAYSGRSFAPVHNDSYPIHESAMTLKPLFIALSLTLFACSKAPEPAPPIAPGAAAPSAAQSPRTASLGNRVTSMRFSRPRSPTANR